MLLRAQMVLRIPRRLVPMTLTLTRGNNNFTALFTLVLPGAPHYADGTSPRSFSTDPPQLTVVPSPTIAHPRAKEPPLCRFRPQHPGKDTGHCVEMGSGSTHEQMMR